MINLYGILNIVLQILLTKIKYQIDNEVEKILDKMKIPSYEEIAIKVVDELTAQNSKVLKKCTREELIELLTFMPQLLEKYLEEEK